MKTINNSIIELGDIDDSGKGRHFKSRFIKDGLVKIEGHGIVLIKKETLDSSLSSMIGTPVIIKHQKVTDENVDELRVGIISDAYFNEPDGWYYCEGVIWDKKAQNLIEQKGWSVSCSYDFLAYNDEGGEENNIKYDKEFTKLNFVHLALVNNPRYERANIVFNCKVDNDKWITIKPHGDESDDYRRLKLEDGETPKEAIERVYGKGDKKDDLVDNPDKRTMSFEEYKRLGDIDEKIDKDSVKWLLNPNGSLKITKSDTKESKLYTNLLNDPKLINHLKGSIEARKWDDPNAKVGDTIIDTDSFITDYVDKLTPKEYDTFDWNKAENLIFDKLNEMEKSAGFKSDAKDGEEKKQRNIEDIVSDIKALQSEMRQFRSDGDLTPYQKMQSDYQELLKEYKERKANGENAFDNKKSINEYKEQFDKWKEDFKKANDKDDVDALNKLNAQYDKLKQEYEKDYGSIHDLEKKHLASQLNKALDSFVDKQKEPKQSDTNEERIEARRKHQEVVKKHNQAYKDFEDGKITMDELEKVDAELEKSNREFYGAETETKEQKSELDQKREAYESTLKTLRDAEHRKWKPKDNDDWIDAIKTETQAKKDLTNLRRDYAESIMANFEEVEDNPYDDKIAEKKARYQELASKTKQQSNTLARQSDDMFSVIPMGQPIIGQRDANFRKKLWNKMDKSWELSKKADYYSDKAQSVGSAGISSDDKNAIKKLATKYNSIKRTHQQMLDANKIIKGKGTDEDKLNKLIASGWSEQKAKELITPSRWGGYVGFPSYELTGNTAEMRRIIDRVISLHQKPMKAQERAEKDTTDYSKYGFEVERNTDINRLQLKFPDKPDANTRSQLKSYGFRWSPREGAWQRQLTQNAEYSLRQFINGINNEKEYEMSLLDEIKRLITNVENDKEQDMDIENGKVDKRKLIDEVAGIMKSAGCDDEDIRTAIGKMEKIGYDKSEDDTADNCGGKQVKNEEKEEPEKDKKEVDEVKEEIKEDVGNKCDNSKSSFDKINGIYNSIKQVAQGRQFVSRQDKLDNAVEYFK